MVYNISIAPQSEGILYLIKVTNSWTNDGLIIMFLLSLFLISFISLKTVSTVKRSMVATAFITMITAFLIKMLDIAVNVQTFDMIVFATIVIFVFSGAALYFDREEVTF